MEHRSRDFRGEAVTRTTGKGFELRGYMAKNGNVVVCVIDLDNERYKRLGRRGLALTRR